MRGVSDFIDTRRGSIGPEARTRLAEAVRQLQAAQDKQGDQPERGHRARQRRAMLAGQAQTLANNDVPAAQRSYTSRLVRRWRRSDMGAVIGGIIIGNILQRRIARRFRRRFGGGLRRRARGMGRSTSFGGSSRSSGRSYSGGGGRF